MHPLDACTRRTDDMRHTVTIALAGWLLVHYHGGTIGVYHTKEDCLAVRTYSQNIYECIPDQDSVPEIKGATTP